ncbi:hypothetical protein G3I76_72595, partial [Streptomyces sp. SID11233]|nr:hypothetical protein [Streptomyces sp. SID11233]
RHMALGKGYSSALIEHAKSGRGEFQGVANGEGKLPGYIGMKSEQRGPFSFAVAGRGPKGDDSTPSELLLQLFVRKVTVVADKTGEFPVGEVWNG